MMAACLIACTVDSQVADHKEEGLDDKGDLHAPLIPPGMLSVLRLQIDSISVVHNLLSENAVCGASSFGCPVLVSCCCC